MEDKEAPCTAAIKSAALGPPHSHYFSQVIFMTYINKHQQTNI